MKQRLSGKYLTLLIALQEGPMDRIEQLAERVGLSRTTVSKDLKWLSGELSSSPGRYFRIVPDLNEPALGLETIDVFLETSGKTNLETLEKLCAEHPYTKYQARCFGHHSGLFIQFRIPMGTGDKIASLLRKIKKAELINRYTIVPTEGVDPLFSVSRLEHWRSESFSWEFDWKKWSTKTMQKTSSDAATAKPMTSLVDSNDISILTHLSYGARRKQKVIIEALAEEGVHFTSQDFSRRLAVLNEHFIRGYLLFLDTEAFDLYSNVILTAKCNHDFAKDLAVRMTTEPVPFRSTLKIKNDFLLWFIRIQPSHLSSLLAYLQENVNELNTSLLDYDSSVTYGVWSGAFNDEKKAWVHDSKFMVTDVLSSLGL